MSSNHGKQSHWTEYFIVVQTLTLLILCTLSYGGMASWVPDLMVVCAAFALIPVGYSWEDPSLRHLNAKKRLLPFLPFALYALYLGVALLNPSHTPRVGGGWIPRAGWVSWLPTVLDRSRAIQAGLPWLAVLFQGGALIYCLNSRQYLRRVTLGILFFALALSIWGALLWFSGTKDVMGLRFVPSSTHFAAFVYKNHWAAFALLGAATAAGYAFHSWDKAIEDKSARAKRLFGFSVLILTLLTLPLPGSRSGTIMGTALLLIVLFVAALRLLRSPLLSPGLRRLGLLGLTILGAGLITYVAWVGGKKVEHDIITRTQNQWAIDADLDSVFEGRLEVASCTWRMAATRPLWGWGQGSFEAILPLYYTPDLRKLTTKSHFAQAHCDWAQIPAETGRIVGLCLLALLLYVSYYSVRWGGTLARWWIVGVWLILTMAIAEFPLQNHAVLLLFFLSLALAYAQAEINRARAKSSRRSKRGKI